MKRGTKAALAGGALALAITTVSQWEGISLVVYRDIVGINTYCWGETENPEPDRRYTVEECNQLLGDRLQEFNDAVSECTAPTPLPDKVRVSFVSLSYNIGKGAFCGSTLARKARAGDLRGACEQLPRWNRAGGKVVRGLVNRRAAELKLCLDGLKP